MKKILSQKTCLGIFAGASLIGVIGLTIAIILVIFVCFGLVQVFDEVTKSIDDQPTGVGFFESSGGWDYRRIALIEPYQAIDTNDDESWTIDLQEDAIRYTYSANATKLDVINNQYIITYEPNAAFEGKRFDEVWFVIIPDENIEKGFSNEEEFLAYLAEKNISTPNLRDIDELYEELRRKGYLEWFPDEYKEK